LSATAEFLVFYMSKRWKYDIPVAAVIDTEDNVPIRLDMLQYKWDNFEGHPLLYNSAEDIRPIQFWAV